MSGKPGGKPRKHPCIKGKRPDRKAKKREEALARAAAKLAR
jgi:hypothetical protein